MKRFLVEMVVVILVAGTITFLLITAGILWAIERLFGRLEHPPFGWLAAWMVLYYAGLIAWWLRKYRIRRQVTRSGEK